MYNPPMLQFWYLNHQTTHLQPRPAQLAGDADTRGVTARLENLLAGGLRVGCLESIVQDVDA